MSTVKVFLWTAPRCVSTAFERSIYEVKNSHVFHEPYGDTYYFGPERQNKRYLDTPVNTELSYEKVTESLTNVDKDKNIVFSKDMAYSMNNYLNILLDSRVADFQHTLLIRNPKKTISSLHKASLDESLTGWCTFDPTECGFKEMYDLYVFVKEHFGTNPVIIDADDLLVNPRDTMKAYCNATGITFSKEMLTWKPCMLDIWNKFDGWWETVANSSGFISRSREEVDKQIDILVFPEEVQNCIEESMKYYKYLRERKLRI